ncbi:Elongator complex protein 5, partial [Globisporangium splendens]
MEEYFTQKCVTADASAPQSSSDGSISTWTTSRRCEFVVVQENQQAHGASRAVLAAIANMESMALASTINASPKLAHVDLSGDVSLFEDQLAELNDDSSNKSSALLAKMQQRIDDTLSKIATKRQDASGTSARPVAVVLDSLNVLLQQNTLQTVLLWLRRLRQQPLIGSLIVRYNAGGGEPAATRHVLGSESTVVALVETPSSLLAYPILAKERRREIPKDMHGHVLLLRQKKIAGHQMQFFPAGQHSTDAKQSESKAPASSDTHRSSGNIEKHEASHATINASSQSHQQAALPVRQEDVSFNLSISVEEQLAKRNVQLPYMHQVQQPATGSSTATNSNSSNNLFFIDEDDPDWDDDDLDDDLDI